MEKEEFIISENQISIDFDSFNSDEEVEESLTLSQSLVCAKNYDWINEEVIFVIAEVENDKVCLNLPKLNLCGKTLVEWVKLAGAGCETRVIKDPKNNIVEVLKNIETDKKIIALFFSDTPLLDKSTFNQVLDYFASNGMNSMTLPRGYIVRKDFLPFIEKFSSSSVNRFNDTAFTVLNNARAAAMISNIIYTKIRSFHAKNGVILLGENSIFIDADVEIGSGTVIEPNNIIRGLSIIGENVILESGNVIKNSIIFDKAVIKGCNIENSKISAGTTVESGRSVKNEEL